MFLIAIAGLSNLHQFVNMEPGPVSKTSVLTFFVANLSLAASLMMEVLSMLWMYIGNGGKKDLSLSAVVRSHIRVKEGRGVSDGDGFGNRLEGATESDIGNEML